jgi:hypothetical protein
MTIPFKCVLLIRYEMALNRKSVGSRKLLEIFANVLFCPCVDMFKGITNRMHDAPEENFKVV